MEFDGAMADDMIHFFDSVGKGGLTFEEFVRVAEMAGLDQLQLAGAETTPKTKR